MRFLPVDPDGPWECGVLRTIGRALTRGIPGISVSGPAELDKPCPDRRNNRDLLSQAQREDAAVRRRRGIGIARQVHALHRTDDIELHDSADAGIERIAGQRLRQREILLWPAPIVTHLYRVHQGNLVTGPEPGEVDDDVVTLCRTLVVE